MSANDDSPHIDFLTLPVIGLAVYFICVPAIFGNLLPLKFPFISVLDSSRLYLFGHVLSLPSNFSTIAYLAFLGLLSMLLTALVTTQALLKLSRGQNQEKRAWLLRCALFVFGLFAWSALMSQLSMPRSFIRENAYLLGWELRLDEDSALSLLILCLVTLAISATMFIDWIVYFRRLNNHRKSFLVIMSIACLCLSAFTCYIVQRGKFDSRIWRETDPAISNSRLFMVMDLRNHLEGNSENQMYSLLGKPYSEKRNHSLFYFYPIGYVRTLSGRKSQFLAVELQNERVHASGILGPAEMGRLRNEYRELHFAPVYER
jgi:hypothetical protein